MVFTFKVFETLYVEMKLYLIKAVVKVFKNGVCGYCKFSYAWIKRHEKPFSSAPNSFMVRIRFVADKGKVKALYINDILNLNIEIGFSSVSLNSHPDCIFAVNKLKYDWY